MKMERELEIVVATVKRAGARALELAKRGFEVQTKRDRSPVTTADLEVNRILQDMQCRHFPEDGWLSEESPDHDARLTKPRIWIVDPIDGTKAFVNGLPEFCISIALVEGNQPVLGVIFNPSTDELFTAVRGAGLSLNGTPYAPTTSLDHTPVVSVSPREYRKGRWAALHGTVQCRPMLSIANALSLVAAGRIHATLTIESENEWDLAAGVLLIEEAGGTAADCAGRPFQFNQASPRFRGVIAVAQGAGRDLRPMLQQEADRAGGERKTL
jgi:myo-inositol-1(or 4)-monophosphatase